MYIMYELRFCEQKVRYLTASRTHAAEIMASVSSRKNVGIKLKVSGIWEHPTASHDIAIQRHRTLSNMFFRAQATALLYITINHAIIIVNHLLVLATAGIIFLTTPMVIMYVTPGISYCLARSAAF